MRKCSIMAQKPMIIKGGWAGAALLVVLATLATSFGYYQFIVVPSQTLVHEGRNLTVNIIAFQFGFKANGTVIDLANPLELRVNDNVTFIIRSEFDKDPSFSIHGFFIQGLMDEGLAVPNGETVVFNLLFAKAGEFTLICTIFCGAGHGDMKAIMRVSP